MLLAPLLLQAAAVALDPIGRQQLPARGCAAYLWTLAPEARLVAMAGADPATLHLALAGAAPVDLPRVAQTGDAALGLAASAEYRADDLVATLAMTVAPRGDLTDGATVPQATLTVRRGEGDALVVPLAGLVGCRAPAAAKP